jgi:tellurite resistance protein
MIGAAKPLVGDSHRFDFLPVGLFGSVMGLTGLGGAWQLAHAHFGVPRAIGDGIGLLAVLAFVGTFAAYGWKCIVAPDAVQAEYRHPIVGNLFGTIFVSMLLLPFVIVRHNLAVARAFWAVGAVGIVIFAWVIATRWLRERQRLADVTPPWIIPVVGLLDMPLAVPALDIPSLHWVMMLGLAVGLFFAIPLFTLILQRQLFETPMPDSLKPSLLILVAPPSVGFSSYLATTGHVDLFAESLYWLTLFLLSVLVGHLRTLPACSPFKVSWWAVSFPLAACGIASLRFAMVSPGALTDAIAIMLLAFSTLVIGGLAVRTLLGIARGELRALSA